MRALGFSFSYFFSCYFWLFTIMVLFHCCHSNNNSDHVLCMDVERQVLLQFKNGLIDGANRLITWGVNDCCKWAGIVCDNFTGHVHQIHLRGYCTDVYSTEYEDVSNQMLRGDLSPSLTNLVQLNYLDLSCNDFGGTRIPRFMGSLGNLRYLNLSHSRFGGIIPPQLGNLSSLHVLCLGSFYSAASDSESTNMMNMQWLSRLRFLRHLDMSGVDLSQAVDWLQVINSLPSLVELHMSCCQLSHINPWLPRVNVSSLSSLDLSGIHFNNSLVLEWIFNVTSLVSLDLSWCYFDGPIPSSSDGFHNLTSLRMLRISGNSFMNSSLVLKSLSSKNLISLDIRSCGISSSVLTSLCNLTSLLSLDLSANQITERIPKSLGNLCNLRHINLANNNFPNISLTYLLGSFFKCEPPSLESLSFESSELSTHLPDQLGQLKHLVHLQLSGNQIAGPIPDSIGRLSFLRSLDLDENMISGPIPDSIGRLSFLRSLDLHENMISGPIPYSIGKLSSLEVLNLADNLLNGSLPDSIGQLSKLQVLDLSHNFLTGVVIEAHFAKLTSLKYLLGEGNKLALRPQLANWIPSFQLQSLNLKSWDLGPGFPLWIQSQRNIVSLEISNTSISSTIPKSFWKSLSSLQYLNMSHNEIHGSLLGVPAGLEILDLSSNNFSGSLPKLPNDSVIRTLDLSNNYFVGSLHHLLCPVISGAKIINLANNHLSGVIPECKVEWPRLSYSYLENKMEWPRLSYLNLENNELSGGIPRAWGSLSSLKLLNMRKNKLSGRLPASLMNLTNLVVLQLAGNGFVGSIPTWFGRQLLSLKVLILRSNQFDGNIPCELCYLTAIQILDLAHNNLSGNIPRCFNNFSVLSMKETRPSSISVLSLQPMPLSYESLQPLEFASASLVMKGREDTYSSNLMFVKMLDLSSNNFSGDIPSELVTLTALQSLDLSRNHLTGRIPQNIGDMKSLEALDISLNMLSGELPMSLSGLSFLSFLNVSCNNLSGRIPVSTQLQSFSESSFFGNKLYGDPLTEHCGIVVPDVDKTRSNRLVGVDWGLIVSMVLGFVAGFWVVVAPLTINKLWRITYFHFFNKLRYKLCDFIHMYR